VPITHCLSVCLPAGSACTTTRAGLATTRNAGAVRCRRPSASPMLSDAGSGSGPRGNDGHAARPTCILRLDSLLSLLSLQALTGSAGTSQTTVRCARGWCGWSRVLQPKAWLPLQRRGCHHRGRCNEGVRMRFARQAVLLASPRRPFQRSACCLSHPFLVGVLPLCALQRGSTGSPPPTLRASPASGSTTAVRRRTISRCRIILRCRAVLSYRSPVVRGLLLERGGVRTRTPRLLNGDETVVD
jgi:hypothetical protein